MLINFLPPAFFFLGRLPSVLIFGSSLSSLLLGLSKVSASSDLWPSTLLLAAPEVVVPTTNVEIVNEFVLCHATIAPNNAEPTGKNIYVNRARTVEAANARYTGRLIPAANRVRNLVR